MGSLTKPRSETNNLQNVLVLSFGFMLLMAAWLTTAGVAQTILESVKVDDPSFTGDGYISQSIINIVASVMNFIAPMIVSVLGIRPSLVFGVLLLSTFTGNFIYPIAWLLYLTSVIAGIGHALVMVAYGIYMTQCSTKETMGKHMGIFWGIMATGQLFGNAFVFWRFQGMNHINSSTRILVTSCLTGVCVLAAVFLAFLRKPRRAEQQIDLEFSTKPVLTVRKLVTLIIGPFRLLGNKHMLLLIPPSMYNGMQLAFFSAIYATCVGFTEAFGGDTRKLVGLAGVMIGFGSVMGGLVFGYLLEKTHFIKSKRKFVVTLCSFIHYTIFILMYINLPNKSPLDPTTDTSFINPPSIPLAMFCAFLFGICDGCLSPQMTAAVGVIWSDDPSDALAVYYFFKGAACAVALYIGTLTGLYNQILIFLAITVLGSISFQINEWLYARAANITQPAVATNIPHFVN